MFLIPLSVLCSVIHGTENMWHRIPRNRSSFLSIEHVWPSVQIDLLLKRDKLFGRHLIDSLVSQNIVRLLKRALLRHLLINVAGASEIKTFADYTNSFIFMHCRLISWTLYTNGKIKGEIYKCASLMISITLLLYILRKLMKFRVRKWKAHFRRLNWKR